MVVVCGSAMETIDLLLIHYDLAYGLRSLVFRTFGIHWVEGGLTFVWVEEFGLGGTLQ